MEVGSAAHCRSSGLASVSGRSCPVWSLRSRGTQECRRVKTLFFSDLGVSKLPDKANREAATSNRLLVKAALAEPVEATSVDTFPRGEQWQVHKFGGTCLATASRIADAAQLIVDQYHSSGEQMVVVSAMGSHITSPVKVTDLLLETVAKAARKNDSFLLELDALKAKHLETARLLLDTSPELEEFTATIEEDISNLIAMLRAISIAGSVTDTFSDFVVGHGELWSARLFATAVTKKGIPCKFMDTRDVLVVTSPDGRVVDVEYAESDAKLDEWARTHGVPKIIVATGFIAKTPQGQVTTLKRNGSDYSATIVGALVRGSHITIWTDVEGVFSADPRKVAEAVCLRSLSYHEAWELSYFGASVLHPRTTMPAMKYNIPIAIRSFFDQHLPGTEISVPKSNLDSDKEILVKGFATIDHVALINVEGTGMVGVHGTASAIFTTVRDAGVNVIMISQASSEHSVCFAVSQVDGDRAVAALGKRFKEAIRAGRISKVEKIDNCCVLAAVGHQMASRKGVSATIFSALAKANVNVRAIAQGCSEYNITVLIDQKDSVRALRAVHGRFYLATLPLGVGLVGPGQVGSTFIAQLQGQIANLRKESDIDVRVLAIANTEKMLLSDSGINLNDWDKLLDESRQPNDLTAMADHLSSNYIPNSVIVDATAADAPGKHYLQWMEKGIHIVTCNKKFNSGPLADYKQLKSLQRDPQLDAHVHYFYEATVGAGLPLIATLQHLIQTGDRIEKIEGVFSGTLSYIFNSLVGDGKFSDIVTEAKNAGFTEPDPRDDLAGMDVARKVTILARECGLDVELKDIPVESLVPEGLQDVASAAEFLDKLPDYDDAMSARMKEAESAGECLRYVGVVDVKARKGSVELKRYPKDHAFAQLQGSDNIVSFTTQRYSKQALVVRGPGAGLEVTAGGLFSDLLRLAAHLGAPS